MNKIKFIVLFSLILFGINISAQELQDEVISGKIYFSHNKAIAQKVMKLAVGLNIKHPWHINSHTPKDEFLIATDLTLASKDGISLQAISYPAAKEYKFDFSDQPVSVYEGNAFIFGNVSIPDNLTPGDYTITLKLEYQACNNETCKAPKTLSATAKLSVGLKNEKREQINTSIFGKLPDDDDSKSKDSLNSGNKVTLTPYLSFDKVFANSQVKLALKVNIAKNSFLYSNKGGAEFTPTNIAVSGVDEVLLLDPFYPEAKEINVKFSKKPILGYADEIVLGALLQLPKEIKPGKYNLKVELLYEVFDAKGNQSPTSTTVTIPLIVAENNELQSEINKDVFKALPLKYAKVNGTKGIADAGNDDTSVTKLLNESSLALSLFIVFWFGLALNLTPCVYPLIPITIGYFGGQSEGRTSRLAGMGALYVLGITLTYSSIGVATALSGGIFGALLQKWYVLIIIAAILLTLSLSMFGVYEFKMPDKWVMSAGGAKAGMYGAFFMGLTMGIVAAPCIGPIVLGLVTFVAAKQEVTTGFLLFFFLSLGLGAPYFVLALFSGKIKKLPRAGLWMEGVKHIFGFILIGMAIYFVLPLITSLSTNIATYILPVFMLGSAIYIGLFDKTSAGNKGFTYFKWILAIVVTLLSIFMVYSSIQHKMLEDTGIKWSKYSKELHEGAVKEHKSVVIDFYADWCIPCKELDAVTFTNRKVVEQTKDFVCLKADLTKAGSPEVELLTQKFNIKGVPTIIVLDSKGKEVSRITGFLPPPDFLEKLKKAK